MKKETKPSPRQTRGAVMKARVSLQLKNQFLEAANSQGRCPSEALRQAMAEWVRRERKVA
jgi:hypothetical protein